MDYLAQINHSESSSMIHPNRSLVLWFPETLEANSNPVPTVTSAIRWSSLYAVSGGPSPSSKCPILDLASTVSIPMLNTTNSSLINKTAATETTTVINSNTAINRLLMKKPPQIETDQGIGIANDNGDLSPSPCFHRHLKGTNETINYEVKTITIITRKQAKATFKMSPSTLWPLTTFVTLSIGLIVTCLIMPSTVDGHQLSESLSAESETPEASQKIKTFFTISRPFELGETPILNGPSIKTRTISTDTYHYTVEEQEESPSAVSPQTKMVRPPKEMDMGEGNPVGGATTIYPSVKLNYHIPVMSKEKGPIIVLPKTAELIAPGYRSFAQLTESFGQKVAAQLAGLNSKNNNLRSRIQFHHHHHHNDANNNNPALPINLNGHLQNYYELPSELAKPIRVGSLEFEATRDSSTPDKSSPSPPNSGGGSNYEIRLAEPHHHHQNKHKQGALLMSHVATSAGSPTGYVISSEVLSGGSQCALLLERLMDSSTGQRMASMAYASGSSPQPSRIPYPGSSATIEDSTKRLFKRARRYNSASQPPSKAKEKFGKAERRHWIPVVPANEIRQKEHEEDLFDDAAAGSGSGRWESRRMTTTGNRTTNSRLATASASSKVDPEEDLETAASTLTAKRIIGAHMGQFEATVGPTQATITLDKVLTGSTTAADILMMSAAADGTTINTGSGVGGDIGTDNGYRVSFSGEPLISATSGHHHHQPQPEPQPRQDRPQARVQGPMNEICITFDDVNEAFEQAKRRLEYNLPDDIDDSEPSDATLNKVGELNEITTEILADRFDLSPDEILNGLPLIDMRRTRMWNEVCPMIARQIECIPNNRYRSFTGHCNNLNYPTWGASNTPFVRYMAPLYADGISEPRNSVMDNGELPSARLISSVVHQEYDQPSMELSVLFVSWGQLVDHDLALATPPRASSGHHLKCCPNSKHPLCMPIRVPADDPLYSRYDIRCLEFRRSLAGVRPNCVLGPRSQINSITASIDANFLYGSHTEQAGSLRSYRGGQLTMWNYFKEDKLKPLLPPQRHEPDVDCMNRPDDLYCFLSGDVRVNEQTQLTTLHVMHVREHNRVAAILEQLNPHWNDERIFQETRHIQAAVIQHLIINEYLPSLLGPELCSQYNLTEAASYWDGYDPETHIGISHAFSTAAFRQGHTFVQGLVRRVNRNHQLVKTHQLRKLFKQPWHLFEPGAVDEFVLGMVDTPAQTFDPFLAADISGHLFEQPGVGIGLDLPSINIQRAREQGVPGYNAFREWCGLPRAYSFLDLEPYLTNYTAYQYSLLYKHVDDIDLFTGGISEQRLPGAQVGPTFACIIARQFSNLRRGDRFWFENPMMASSFSPNQLMEIKKMTLARILCSNSDGIDTIQRSVFHLPHPIFNDRVPCHLLPDMDLRYWQEVAAS